MSLPLRINSSRWAWDTEQAIPGSNTFKHCWHFSHPRISRFQPETCPPEWQQWWGWAHTPLLETEARLTPSITVYTWQHSANHSRFLPISAPFVLPKPLLFLFKETEFYTDVIEVPLQPPLGPFVTPVYPFQAMSTIFWIVNCLLLKMVFILAVDAAKRDLVPAPASVQQAVLDFPWWVRQ